MQEFTNFELNEHKREFTTDESTELLQKRMNQLQSELALDGFEETKRVIVGRNDKCPCGSKRKFKKCCMHKANQR